MLRNLAALAAFALLFAPSAEASTIVWGLPTDTTAGSNVSTHGSLVKAFDSGGAVATVAA